MFKSQLTEQALGLYPNRVITLYGPRIERVGPPGRKDAPSPQRTQDAKVAAVALVAGYAMGLRGAVLLVLGAAPFALSGNAQYRKFAARLPF